VKPLYIVGTQRDIGKTTLSIGLVHALRGRGLKVGYLKPLGQRVVSDHGHILHDDARVMAAAVGAAGTAQPDMAVPLPRGAVEKQVADLDTDKLLGKVRQGFDTLAEANDTVIIEAMGHVAMGSCLGLSAADVCRRLGAKALLISGGGIGRAIDEIAMCETFLKAKGAEFLGVVINKVWPEKYTRIRRATTKGLANIGIRSFGTVPYEEDLSAPTMEQVHGLIGGEILSGGENLQQYVRNTIVAAMEASHMVRYLREATLVITPGDRSDNILAALSVQMLGEQTHPPVAGVVLTGGFRPDGTVMRLINDSHLPVILVKEDTYSIASRFRQTVFKITPDDQEKVDLAVCMVAEYVDVDGIVEALSA
jgi:BioD-like phosphotransacetylase family protein